MRRFIKMELDNGLNWTYQNNSEPNPKVSYSRWDQAKESSKNVSDIVGTASDITVGITSLFNRPDSAQSQIPYAETASEQYVLNKYNSSIQDYKSDVGKSQSNFGKLDNFMSRTSAIPVVGTFLQAGWNIFKGIRGTKGNDEFGFASSKKQRERLSGIKDNMYMGMDEAKRMTNYAPATTGYGIAKQGMVNLNSKINAEVEGGELKLRKGTNGKYTVVKNYTGPSHEGGGIDEKVVEGDIIVPVKHRNAVLSALESDRHDLVDRVVNSLPVIQSTGRTINKAQNGEVVKDNPFWKIPDWMNTYSESSPKIPYDYPKNQNGVLLSDRNPDYNTSFRGDWYDKNIMNNPVLSEKQQTVGQPNRVGEWWKGLGTEGQIGAIGTAAAMTYNMYNLLRPKQPMTFKPLAKVPSPTNVSPKLINPDLSSMRQSVMAEADKLYNTQLANLSKIGINPVVASKALSSQRNETELKVASEMAQESNKIKGVNAQMINRANEFNSANQMAYNKDVADRDLTYNQFVSEAKWKEKQGRADEQWKNTQAIFTLLDNYRNYLLKKKGMENGSVKYLIEG